MNASEARRRFTRARVARLATVGGDGYPHLVPVVFAVVDERVLMAVDFKPKRTARLRRLDNIAATGRVSLLVDEYDEDWDALWWVRVDGHATVVPATAPAGVVAIDALVARYAQYTDTRPEGPAIVVENLRWRWWSARSGGA